MPRYAASMSIERFPVEEGNVSAFARALGETDPVFFGPDAFAPPTYVIAGAQWDEDYPLRPRPGQPWRGSGRDASGVPPVTDTDGVQLHAEQHFEFVRPVRVGDVLTAAEHVGETWEKSGRSGRLVFTEYVTEYRDVAGELVVTARLVGVRTEKREEN